MTERKHSGSGSGSGSGEKIPRTTPSQAPGESGDPEARRQADEAVLGRRGDLMGRTADRDDRDAGAHAAKRQRSGVGREEQVRPHDPRER
ncbi:hypothetical protein [Streptomyces sp. NPDC047014]|uniref:hypothetical protein n=1 Tax=Streptomyces sp. NPDC047014 TaxID=3155736 RepID=UPI0033CA0172